MSSTLKILCCQIILAFGLLYSAPFEYHEDFEGKDPVTFWTTNGKYEVNFKGITEEEAHGGKKSFKLDVTFKNGSYLYWQVPLSVPVAGKLNFSGWIKIVPPSSARVGLGPNYQYVPTIHSGCGSFEAFGTTGNVWKEISGDLVERGLGGADSVLRRYVDGATGENVSVFLDRWGIFVYGRPGQRLVCYIDDVSVEGNVPDAVEHRRRGEKRFASLANSFAKRLEQWKSKVHQSSATLQRFTVNKKLPARARTVLDYANKQNQETAGLLSQLEKRGYGTPAETGLVEQRIRMLDFAVPNLEALAKGGQGQSMVVFVPPAITNQRILPDAFPISAPISKEVRVAACPGEYESATFAVFAFEEIRGLEVRISPLRGKAGTVPADAVDVRVVKCWYQGAGNIGHSRKRVLKPELLLKDDGLIRVDTQKRRNFLRHADETGQITWVDISRDLDEGDPPKYMKEVRPKDAETLQPIHLSAQSTKQFWLTLRPPENSRPGDYEARITLRSRNSPPASLTLLLTVHPFRLERSPLIYSIYYRSRLSRGGEPTITSERKSEEQFLAELKDMKAHGVEFPSNYQGYDEALIRRVMELRDTAGLSKGPFFSLGLNTSNVAGPEKLAAKQAEVKKWLKLIHEYGYQELYVYGADEARGERLISQRAAWRAVQKTGAKTFVAGYKKTFEAMGALLNCIVYPHFPEPEEAEKFHRVGSLIFSYANPQVGVEEPETYRRNYGLVLWKSGFDGAMDYAYQHSFTHIWNDFDDPRYRDHVFAYPTINGVVDTLAWEGFREGVDDVRYLATLMKTVSDAKAASRNPALIRQAEAWIKNLDPARDLNQLRSEIVGFILKLRARQP